MQQPPESETPGEGWTIATFVVRWILGLLFLMAGWWKVFDLTAVEHARRFFVEGFAEHWIPAWFLWALGVTIPYVELGAGVLLCVGFRVRTTLAVLGVLLIVTTYGHALQQPLFNIDGHTFTRLALIVFLLLAPVGADRFTLQAWLARRQNGP